MRQRVSMGLRVVSSAVALVYFWANVAMAHSTESNVWAQRRRHMENNCAGASDNPLLASLPVPASSLAQLPSLSLPAKTNSALNDDLAKSLPAGFAAKHAALFNALPTAHGTIRKIWLPANNAGDRIVVHIQDVHQNLEAQRHIGGAVDALLQAHQADLVALEGAFAPIDVKAYHDFGDRDAIAQTADCLLRENLITGPVRTFMTTPAVLPPLVGVDDQTHYNANVEAYRQSAPRVEEFKREIAAQKKDMERAKAGVFSNELLAFDAVVGAYKEERASLGDYVAALSPTKGVGQTGLLAQALAMEKEIDFQQVERERKELIDGLVKNLSKSQIDQLIQESVAYRAGEVRYGEFYRSLQSLCHEAKIELSRFPRMDAYICYVMLSDRIDGEKLLGEMATLEKERYANLARSAEEKVLVARSNELRLKERLLNFALTPVEWAEYKTLKSSEVPSPARGRGQGEGARSDVDGGLTLTSFVSFYESAQARDDDMARNLLVSMDKGNVKQAVLVTGGYHTEGVAQRLQAAGVTVVTFTPRIEKLDTAQGSAYLSIFTQEKTPLEKLFAGEKLFVSQLVAADHVVKKGGLATLLVTALEALKGVPSRAIAATLKYFGADPATFDVSVKHGVVTIKEWGQDARAAVQTTVQRTAEGNLTFKETVVGASVVVLIGMALFPSTQMAMTGLVTAGFSALVSIPGVSLITVAPAGLACAFPVISAAVQSFVANLPAIRLSTPMLNSLENVATVALGLTFLTSLLTSGSPRQVLVGGEQSPASIIRRVDWKRLFVRTAVLGAVGLGLYFLLIGSAGATPMEFVGNDSMRDGALVVLGGFVVLFLLLVGQSKKMSWRKIFIITLTIIPILFAELFRGGSGIDADTKELQSTQNSNNISSSEGIVFAPEWPHLLAHQAPIPSDFEKQDPLAPQFLKRYQAIQDGWYPFDWMKRYEAERFVRDFLLMDRGVVPAEAWVNNFLDGFDFDMVPFPELIEKIRNEAKLAQPGTFVEVGAKDFRSQLSMDWVGIIKSGIFVFLPIWFIGTFIAEYRRSKRLIETIDGLNVPPNLLNFFYEKPGTHVGVWGFDEKTQAAIQVYSGMAKKEVTILPDEAFQTSPSSVAENKGPFDYLVIKLPEINPDDYFAFFSQLNQILVVGGSVFMWTHAGSPWDTEIVRDLIKKKLEEAGFAVQSNGIVDSRYEIVAKKVPESHRRPTREEIVRDIRERLGVDQYRIGKLDMDVLVRAVGGDREASLTLYLPHEQAMTAVDGRPGNNAGSLRASDALTRLSEGRSFWSPYRFGQRAALRAHLKDHPASLVGQGSGAIFSRLMRMASGERATPQQSVPLVVHPVATQTELAEAVALARSLAELNSLSPKNPVFLAIIPDGEINSKDIQTALAGTPLGHHYFYIFDQGVTPESIQNQIKAATEHFGVDPANVLPIVTRALEISARSKFDLSAVRSLPEGLSRNILLMLLNQLLTIDTAAVWQSLDASVRTAQLSKKSA